MIKLLSNKLITFIVSTLLVGSSAFGVSKLVVPKPQPVVKQEVGEDKGVESKIVEPVAQIGDQNNNSSANTSLPKRSIKKKTPYNPETSPAEDSQATVPVPTPTPTPTPDITTPPNPTPAQPSCDKSAKVTLTNKYNTDINDAKQKRDQAVNDADDIYFSAPEVAREKFKDIWDPFEREKLVAQYVAIESMSRDGKIHSTNYDYDNTEKSLTTVYNMSLEIINCSD